MTPPRRRVVLGVLTALYLAGAVAVGFWPTPVDRPIDGGLQSVLDVLHAHGLPWWFGYDQVEFIANVLFFVPIGVLLCLTIPARFWYLAIVGGVLGSAAIELGQLLFLPARYASWGDILANSTGTVIGVLIVVAGRGLLASRNKRRIARS